MGWVQKSGFSCLFLMFTMLLAGCGTPTPLPPPGTFEPQLRTDPTLPPPSWTEASEAITLENAPRITYLGRLDANTIPSTIFAYAFSPDGSRLVGLNNEQLIGWDLITGKLLFNTSRSEAQFVYYSSDKTEVYTVDNAGTIRIYDADIGRFKDDLPGQPAFNGAITYFPDDGLLAMGGQDGQVKVWDVAARQSLVTIEAHTLQITALAFSGDASLLATASDDKTVKVWNWRERTQQTQVDATAERLAFPPDGAQFAVGEADKITLWNTADGKLLYTLATSLNAVENVLTYSPDGLFLLNSGSVPAMTIWDVQTGLPVNTLPNVGGDSTTAAFSPDGQLLVTAVLGGAVSFWDMSKIRDKDLARGDLPVNTRQIIYGAWSADGFLLALFDATGPIQIWGVPASTDATATPG